MHPALPDILLDFLEANARVNASQVALAQKPIHGFSASFVANQLDCRQRAADKLPSWLAKRGVVFPPKANLEQSSSEQTAQLKCRLLKQHAPEAATLVDLTGGFGVDSFFFSRAFAHVVHVEPTPALLELARHNHTLLGAHNIGYQAATAEDFLASFPGQADWLYLDPSRKTEGRKVFRLADCQPDVTHLLPALWAHTTHVLIKTAPLLDITEALTHLPHTKTVAVVAVNNECREVLYFLQKDFAGHPQVLCLNLAKTEETFSFQVGDEAQAGVSFQVPQQYLYEPNASILKAGAFKLIGERFGLQKLAPSTHLYTSNHFDAAFPGRVFKNLGPLQELRPQLHDNKANVLCRNHPLTPDALKKKYRLHDGGDAYVLAFSGLNDKWILVAERLK